MIVLGIESSCDETAASLVADGVRVHSSAVASQVAVHNQYGGVVPELASRCHVQAIVPVVEEALSDAGMTSGDIDAVAVTQGPGLVGALLVGFSFAKGYAAAIDVPWVGINHLEAHVHSVFLEADPPPFPFVALLVSGGHTSIYEAVSHTRYHLLGQTLDDAAGEAYDKVAKMLGLGYPGGQQIDRLAKKGDPARIRFPRTYLDKNRFDFSFSGIKTAVNRYIQTHPDTYRDETCDIVAGFQESVVEVLSRKLIQAARRRNCRHAALVGGVAANSRLREYLCAEAAEAGVTVHVPDIQWCGDNAAMIASLGYHVLQSGQRSEGGDDVYSRADSRRMVKPQAAKGDAE